MHFPRSALAIGALLAASFSPSLSAPLAPRDDSREYPAHQVYQFPNGSWVEEIAVRANNDLLVSRVDVPEVWLIPDPTSDTSNGTAQLLYHFPNIQTVPAVTEIRPDVFGVVVGNWSIETGPINGTWSLWSIDLTSYDASSSPAVVTKLADIPQASFLNGLAAVNPNTLLTADIVLGRVFALDISTGAVTIASSDTLISPKPNPIFGTRGANGIRVAQSPSANGTNSTSPYVYFATSGSNIFGRFPVDPITGKQTAPAVEIVSAFNSTLNYDDFAITADGARAFLPTGSANSLEEIWIDPFSGEGKGWIVAGNLNSTLLAEPTSAAFGRANGDGYVYVSTAGGFAAPVNGDIKVGAQVVAVDIRGF